MTAKHISPAIGEFALRERAALLAENQRLREALEDLVICAEWNSGATASPEWGGLTAASITRARAALEAACGPT